MDKLLTDFPFIIYSYLTIISIYGFLLFIWWWIKQGKASHIYAYITFLFLGTAIKQGTECYSRYLFVSHDSSYSKFLSESIIWPGRLVIYTLMITFVVVHLTWRLVKNKEYK